VHVVIFEVEPKAELAQDYFDLAAKLRPELEKIERFASLSDDGKFLSLSFWRDEAAIAHWREHAEHRLAQTVGKQKIFHNYRIRVATVDRDYSLQDH
jgi:heme-degrading monooxygenase HmoA